MLTAIVRYYDEVHGGFVIGVWRFTADPESRIHHVCRRKAMKSSLVPLGTSLNAAAALPNSAIDCTFLGFGFWVLFSLFMSSIQCGALP